DQLVRHFPRILSVDFTAEVEQELDEIAAGDRDWVQVLNEFYGPFTEALEAAEHQMERVKPEAVPTETPAPDCGSHTVLRTGRNGRFLGCSAFPRCKKTMPLPEENAPTEAGASPAGDGAAAPAETAPAPECPNCGRPMLLRKGRFGEFY